MMFADLEYNQQFDLLTSAAQLALGEYALESPNLEPLSYYNNAVYRVSNNDGSLYTFRIHRPGHKRIEWLESELIWLLHLRQKSPLLVPEPVPTKSGPLLSQAHVSGMAQPLPCALFRWLDGRVYSTSDFQPHHAQRAGRLLAQLHQAASAFKRQPDFERPRLDTEGLFGENSPYNPGEGAKIFTDDQKAVFAQIGDCVRATMTAIEESPGTFGMIHADFLSKNIVFRGDTVGAIDFDECSWGYYHYDLAPLLLQFKSDPRYPSLRAAYLDGYTALRSLTASDLTHLEVMIAARHLASCRWQAGNLHNPNIRVHAAEIIARRTEDLRQFLQTGVMEIRGSK